MQYYEKESATQEGKVQKMKEDGKDIYDIKKQEEVLQEFYMMIPNSKSRLDASIQDLKAFLVRPCVTMLVIRPHCGLTLSLMFAGVQDESGDSPDLADTEALTETNGLLAKLDNDGEEPMEKVIA